MFENKVFGIFQILDNECKLKEPKLKNFVNAVNEKHKKKLAPNRANAALNSFTIRHFAQDTVTDYCCVSIMKITNRVYFLSQIFISNISEKFY